MCLCCDGVSDEYLIWGLSFFAMVTVWPAPLIWRILFLALISIEFKFLVSIKIHHIQRIQQITSPFQVVSTPVYLLPLSPPVQMILSVFFLLIYSCPLCWSRSGNILLLLRLSHGINAFICCIALLFYDCIFRYYPLYRKLLLFSWWFLAFFN